MKTESDCIFCKIVLGQSPCFRLLEDEDTLAIMDIFPASEGHCLVLTKEHYPTLFDITDEAFAAVSRSVSRGRVGSQPGSIAGRTEFGPGKRGRRPPNGQPFPCSRATAQTRGPITTELGRKCRRPTGHRRGCEKDPRESLNPVPPDFLSRFAG
jgi:hypothetical protein